MGNRTNTLVKKGVIMLSELDSYMLEEHRKNKGWLKSEPKKKTCCLAYPI